jgi:hypothetical protein
MPRFVVLLHETPANGARRTHFDLMLENGATLLTWALHDLPTTGIAAAAERLAEHRSAYLDYEGPLSGDRGSVRRVDSGDFDWIEHRPARYVTRIRGKFLCGQLTIEETDSDTHRWRVDLSG